MTEEVNSTVFASVYIPLIDSFSTVQIYDLSYIHVYKNDVITDAALPGV